MPSERPSYDPPHVLLMVETSIAFGRGILRGITRWLTTHHHWSVYLEQHELAAAPPTWLADWRGDGVICRVMTPALAQILHASDIPVIDLNDLHDDLGFPLIRTDHVAVGRLAAEHLIERGFRTLGFCGYADQPWSHLRRKGFETRASEAGIAVHSFDSDWFGPDAPEWEVSQQRIQTWLAQLARPCGVMACNDLRGQQVLDAARRAKLAVPEVIGVIGVDDDELLCELCEPPLSSVRCNPEEIGYQAAERLDMLMDRRSPHPTHRLVPPLGVATRQSTDILAIDDPTIAAVVKLIREQACSGLTISHIVRQFHVSRTKLERQFRDALGRTLQQEIRSVQMKRTRQLLSETDLSLEAITPLVGFAHASYLSHAFKREVGESPREYRRRAQAAGR